MISLATLSGPCDNPALAPRAARLGLEEAWGDGVPGRVCASLFGLLRASEGDERPVVLAATTTWLRDQGRWFRDGLKVLGLPDERLLFVETSKDVQTLWALEESLKSNAVAGAVAAVEAVSLLASRRLDLAAREAGAACLLLRTREPKDISAARRRWRIAPAPSGPHPYDDAAPGATRLTAALTRSRGEPLGEWILEWDDEAHRFRLASGLADHGLVPDGRTAALG